MSYQFEPHLDLTLIISQPEKVIKESTNLSLNINMLLLRPLRNYVFVHVRKTYRFYKAIELIFILYHLPQGRWLIIWMTGKFYWLNGQMINVEWPRQDRWDNEWLGNFLILPYWTLLASLIFFIEHLHI